jgi:eukaryotic-like serine/threonine-protein kinase
MGRVFEIGEVCGGHQILRVLGAGGFSDVYEAVDAAGARRALKILHDQAPGAHLGARLAREVEALTRIEHVNVVQVHEAGIEDDRVYLVLELVEGVTLRDKLGDPYVLAAIEDIVRWMQQACEGVAEAHRAGVIHGDLKPANILVTASSQVKVIDFGIATLRSWNVSSSEQLVGTALYMAPEQLQGRPGDATSDVYAMGTILYEGLAGVHPLGLDEEEGTVFTVFQAQLLDDPLPLSQAAPDVPADLAALVHRALAKDPARRVPTMQALADGLAAVLAALPDEPRISAPRLTLRPVDGGPRVPRSEAPGRVPSHDGAASGPKPRAPSEPALDPSPLAVTHAVDLGRSALPPPAPRLGGSRPPPSRPPPSPPPEPPADEGSPTAGPQSSRTSTRRGSSGMSVVAEAARALPSRRALPILAATLAVLAAVAAIWAASQEVSPTTGAAGVASPPATASAGPAPGAPGTGGSDGGH